MVWILIVALGVIGFAWVKVRRGRKTAPGAAAQ
jgi:hypothetical protein